MGWRQGQAYSQDLRERVLAAIDGGMSVREAGPTFRVSISYIYKALGRRRNTGETAARPQRCHLSQKLAPYHDAIRERILVQSDATLDELRAWLLESYGVSVSQGGMWNTLRRLGLMLKKSRGMRLNRMNRTSPSVLTQGGNASEAVA